MLKNLSTWSIKVILFIILFFLLDFSISVFLVGGLMRYYGIGTHPEILIIGHSHLMLGVDKELLENKTKLRVAKYTREGATIEDRAIMIRQFLNKDSSKIRVIVYGVDAWMFNEEKLSENSYKMLLPFLSDTIVQDYIKNKCSSFEYHKNFLIKTTRFDELLVSSAFRGYLSKWTNLKFGQVDTISLKKDLLKGKHESIKVDPEKWKSFEKTVNYINSKNIRLVLLYVPTISIYNNLDSVNFKAINDKFVSLESKYQYVKYVDLNPGLSTHYELFYDPIHLNPSGQKIVTKMLSTHLKKYCITDSIK
jgi:hypothetical protein